MFFLIIQIKAQISVDAQLPEPCNKITLSTENVKEVHSLKIYPVPSDGVIFIEFLSKLKSSTANVKIFDMAGALVYKKTINVFDNKVKNRLSLNNLQTGVYILILEVDTEKFSRKIIINKNK